MVYEEGRQGQAKREAGVYTVQKCRKEWQVCGNLSTDADLSRQATEVQESNE
jgi:hypothetical protein